MLKKIQGQIIVRNCAIFLAVFTFVLFAFVQGTITHYDIEAQNDLLRISNDAFQTIRQTLQFYHLETDPQNNFTDNANYFCKAINAQSGLETQIYNKNKKLLTGSQNDLTDLSKVIETVSDTAPTAFMMTKKNGASLMHFAAQIKSGENVIGILGFVYPMGNIPAVIEQSMIFYLLSLLVLLPVIIIFSYKLSKKAADPLQNMTSTVDQINSGHYDLQIASNTKNEFDDLAKSINQLVSNANTSINQIEFERARLSRVFASLDDGVLAVDKNGNVIMDNPYIGIYLNVPEPKSIYDFQYQSFMRDIFDDLRSGKAHISFEIECNNRNLLIIGSPLQNEELEENYLIIIRNVTTEHQIQNEQHKFISSVSHELRTPLTTIIGYTDMLTRRNITEGAALKRSLTTINREGHRLLRLVDDLININQLDHFEFAYHKTNIDLNRLLDEIVEQMNIKAELKGISINYKSDNKLPEFFGDYDRLSQLFINIIHNAIKYSNSGDIIDVVAALENDNIVISVRDYGVGIAETEQKKVFAAFYRVEEDRTRSENEGGAGLGLFLVKQIVDNHQGSIDVQSVLGEGTIFTISLPINSMPSNESVLIESSGEQQETPENDEEAKA